MSLKKTSNVGNQIRWLIRRDMDEVLQIDRSAFKDQAWTEDDYVALLRQRNAIGTVCESECMILGVMVYDLHKHGLVIRRFAVHGNHLRVGTGTSMVNRLKDKLDQQRRSWIEIDVPEEMLTAQLFFRQCGFEFVEFVRDGSSVEYRMRYQI